MSKSTSRVTLSSIEKAVDRVSGLVLNRTITFAAAQTPTETKDHEQVAGILTALHTIEQSLQDSEADAAARDFASTGDKIAMAVGDASQLDRILKLVKSGRLDTLLADAGDHGHHQEHEANHGYDHGVPAEVANDVGQGIDSVIE